MYVDVLIYYHKSCTIGRTFLVREIVNKKKIKKIIKKVFWLGCSSDVKYNKKIIKVLNKAVNDNREDLYKLVNRLEISFDQIQTFAE